MDETLQPDKAVRAADGTFTRVAVLCAMLSAILWAESLPGQCQPAVRLSSVERDGTKKLVPVCGTEKSSSRS